MTAGSDAGSGPAASVRHRQWMPVLLAGLIITGAVPLSTWFSGLTFGWHTVKGWGGYYVLGGIAQSATFPSPGGFYLLDNVPYSGAQFYLGWYWAVALAGGYLVTVLWYRRSTRGRALLASAAVVAALALALPFLARVLPALWLHPLWIHGIPALLVIGVALAAAAWQERTRGSALVCAGYAALALPAGWLITLDVDPMLRWLLPAGPGSGWPGVLLRNPLTALLLPGLLLVTAGLAGLVRWRRISSPDDGAPSAA